MIDRKANYLIEVLTAERIVLRDVGPWDKYMTITNAADTVIEEVEQQIGIGNRRVFYTDSEGEWTELLVEGGRFAGFAPGRI